MNGEQNQCCGQSIFEWIRFKAGIEGLKVDMGPSAAAVLV